LWENAKNWAASSGNGKPLTAGWARHGSGGEKVGKNPTDRGKNGTKKSLLVDAGGGPLGVAIDGANVPDCKLLQATIEAIVVERPKPTPKHPQNLCLDKGYDNPTGRETVARAKYTPHIRRIGEEKTPCNRSRGEKPRRWVVERTLAWLSKCRGILIRYDKKDINYLGLIQLACALCWYRRLHQISRGSAKGLPT
jgi:putative transposase